MIFTVVVVRFIYFTFYKRSHFSLSNDLSLILVGLELYRLSI